MYPPAQILEGAALPPDVRDLPDPPTRLYLHGIAPRGVRVAIVGTRRPTDEALAFGEALARQLAARGVAVLSGGAKGIDASAHRGALLASGQTLVVAPSSFDRPYPAEHRALFEEIVASGGGYLSRFAAGVEPRRHQFFDRNALLAALCHALVVVEAPLRSGSRNAAAWARRLGRGCFVVPSAPWNQRGRGCIAELQLGARPLGAPEELLGWLAAHLDGGLWPPPGEPAGPGHPGAQVRHPAEDLGEPASPRPARRRRSRAAGPAPAVLPEPGPPPDTTCAALLRALASGPRYVEQLADAIPGASLAELNHAIFTLLASGAIAREVDGELTIARR